jgi:TetR/AcrR family transcriptional regulator, fatty acid metabolism regulator protein
VRTRETGHQPETGTLGGRARRAQLVDCAVQSLCELGFAGTSIAEVARRAGVSKGVVTYHFPTKDALLWQVVAALYERTGSSIAERVATETTPLGALVSYIEANLAFVAEHTAHVRAVLEVVSNVHGPEADPTAAADGLDALTAHVQAMIQRGLDSGEFAAVDAGTLATIIRAAIDTAAARGAKDPDFDHSLYSRQLVLLVRRALEPRA